VSEEMTMYEELTYIGMLIDRLKKLAIEMQSGEQDSGYVSKSIAALFTEIGKHGQDDDGVNFHYYVDLEHPENPKSKLVFEFNAFISDEEQ